MVVVTKITRQQHNPDYLSSMRFQKRDAEILACIHAHDGILARRQIQSLFWEDKESRSMERRLSFLKQLEYLQWPTTEQRRNNPIPEPIVWLGWKGALLLAGQSGIQIESPARINENQLRSLDRKLRERGFYWLREPRWSQTKHDLTVNDIRFWIATSLQKSSEYVLEEWKNESTFRIQTDFVDYQIRSRDGEMTMRRRGVCPDGYFTLVDIKRKSQGEPYRARFLLELDMATHDNPSFGNEKVAAGIAYIKSPQYLARFGSNSGRWLVVTTGVVRLKNLVAQTRERAGSDASAFYFTTLEFMGKANIFQDPIWINSSSNGYVKLI